MRHARLVLIALLPCLSGSPAFAQNAGPILDFFASQIDRGIARQQQQQIQRQQQQQYNQNYQIFLAAWNDCFERSDLARCDFALTYPSLLPADYQRLVTKRSEIATAIQALEEAARREQAERAAQERQRRIEAVEAERQRRIEAANEARRLQLEREQEAARQRQLEVERQRAEAERIRRTRIAEERRAAGMQALIASLEACRRYDVGGCDRALQSEYANRTEFDSVRAWRDAALAFRADGDACQSGSIEACDRALASPAASDGERAKLNEWRTAASPINRAVAALSSYSTAAVAWAQSVPSLVRELPLSTQITGGVATALGLALAFVMVRRAPAAASASATVLPLEATGQRTRRRSIWRSLRRRARRIAIRFRIWRRPAAAPAAAPVTEPILTIQEVGAPDVPDVPRDTETAVDAMQLALAYFDEFSEDIGNTLTDPAYATKVLNTLSLISRQLDVAERADPSATLTVEDKDGDQVILTLAAMKSNAIYFEAMCRMADNPKRSIKLFEQVLDLTPDAANAYFWIGMLNADMFRKREAVAALEQAVALDPRNMGYRKELLRAQSISGSQVAYDRAARGARTTVSIARWAWFAFWIILILVIAIGIANGNFVPAIVLFILSAVVGLLKQCIGIVKSAFTGEE